MLKKAFLKIFILVLLSFIVLVVTIFGILFYYGADLPDSSQLKNYDPPVLSRIFASDGRLVNEYSTERRVFVPLSLIPPKVINAFLAAEDQNFFSHHGIDPLSIVRAAFQNFSSSKKRPGGASTITQQVARLFFLTNEVSLSRKIKEAILAFRIEQSISKQKIMEIYLNQIFLGHRSYGVAAASISYFGKALEDLTIPEIAFLAGLPKAPSRYSPSKHPKLSLQRRNWVLGRMHSIEAISEEEYREAIKTPIVLQKNNFNTINADYFAEAIRRDLLVSFGEKSLLEGGLFIRSSIDSKLQQHCNEVFDAAILNLDKRHGWRGPIKHLELKKTDAKQSIILQNLIKDMDVGYIPEGWQLALVSSLSEKEASILLANSTGIIPIEQMKWAGSPLMNGKVGPSITDPYQALKVGDVIFVRNVEKNIFALEQIPKISGGMVVMDANTGRVLALKGGFSFHLSQFNRATQALRQCGSSIKPFIYLTALQNGALLSSIFEDAPIEIKPGPNQPVWKPRNFMREFEGNMTMRQSFESSNNIITIKLALFAGVENILANLRKFDIADEEFPHLSLALGAAETTVLRLTAAYGMLANGGEKITPSLVDWIQDRRGKIIFKQDKRKCVNCHHANWSNQPVPVLQDNSMPVISSAEAFQITSLLEGAISNSKAKLAAVEGQVIAGKSGTSNDSKDAWFVAYTPTGLIVGLYLGYDQPQDMGRFATGGWLAAPVIQKFLSKALRDQPSQPFRVPSDVQFVRINKKTGFKTDANDQDAIWEVFSDVFPYKDPVSKEKKQDNDNQSLPITNSPAESLPALL